MHLSIVRASSGKCDVLILYPSVLVFSDSMQGVRYIENQASTGVVPFATLSVPDSIASPSVIARLSGYEHCALDVYSDTFVEELGIVHGAALTSKARLLPQTQFWRAIAALYAFELGRSSVEW